MKHERNGINRAGGCERSSPHPRRDGNRRVFLFGGSWSQSRYSQLHLPVTEAWLLYQSIKARAVVKRQHSTIKTSSRRFSSVKRWACNTPNWCIKYIEQHFLGLGESSVISTKATHPTTTGLKGDHGYLCSVCALSCLRSYTRIQKPRSVFCLEANRQAKESGLTAWTCILSSVHKLTEPREAGESSSSFSRAQSEEFDSRFVCVENEA